MPVTSGIGRALARGGRPIPPAIVEAIGPIVGNRAVQRLVSIQRCGQSHGPDCPCHASLTVQRQPAPTTAPAPAPPIIAEPLCSLKDLHPRPFEEKLARGKDKKLLQKPVVTPDEVKWIDSLKNPPGLVAQIDLGFFSKGQTTETDAAKAAAEKRLGKCEAQERKRVGKIKDPVQQGEETKKLEARIAVSKAEVSEIETEFKARYEAGRFSYRADFLRTMRCLLGPDPAVENHFSKMKEVNPPGGGLFVHEEAADRMAKVREELEKPPLKSGLPSTDVGQALRGRHIESHGPGYWGHGLGFSIDWRAYENPHIKEPSTIRLIKMLTGDQGYMKYTTAKGEEMSRGERREAIRELGEFTVRGEHKEKEGEFTRLLDQTEDQIKKMAAASDAMRSDPTILPQKNRDDLEQLKKDYIALMPQIYSADGEIKAAQKKIDQAATPVRAELAKQMSTKQQKVKPKDVPADTVEADPRVQPLVAPREEAKKKRAELQVQKEALQARLPAIFDPWLKRIKSEFIDDFEGKAKKEGVAAENLPSKGELDAIDRILKVIAAREALFKDPVKRKADKTLQQMYAKNAEAIAAFDAALVPGASPPAEKSAAQRLAESKTVRSWVWKKSERVTWISLHDSLSNDLTYTLGVVEKKPEKKGYKGPARYRLQFGGAGDKPLPIAQLIEKRRERGQIGGMMTLDPETEKNGFNMIFVKTMVKYGFDPGAAWGVGGFGAPDTMHFDYLEGWKKVKVGEGQSCGPYGVK